MERTLLAFLFYFQSFRNGRLFSYPKSKGERENMNKLVKRLLTGTLAFATILTALPVTAVHASGNQYWTESAERVGYIEHVMNAVRDLLTYYDAERTAFSIINRYVRFVDKEADKKRSDWKLSVRWAWFIGENREPLKLTTKPEPYTLDRTLRWIQA